MKRGVFLVLIIIIALTPIILAQDEDGDGYCISASEDCPSELDCNDNNPLINPGADEGSSPDGVDNDCNGIVDDITILCVDSDFDGYNITNEEGAECGTIDCDDTRADISPGLSEICDDGIDNDCDGEIDQDDEDCIPTGCRVIEEATLWYNCNDPINSANDSDTVHLVLITQDCDENSDVTFNIYEYSPGQDPALIEEGLTPPDYVFLNIPDETGNPTNANAFISIWNALYLQDDDDTPEPEYYFEAVVEEPNGLTHTFSSGTTEDKLLKVYQCPDDNPNCGKDCVLDMGGMSQTNQTNQTNQTETTCDPSQINIDCSGAPWSECDPLTRKMTRDITQCTITGTTDDACIMNAVSTLQTERSCVPNNQRPVTNRRSYCGDGTCDDDETEEDCPEDCLKIVCGDKRCDEGEEEICPEDCQKSSLGWIIFAIIILLAIAGSIVGYYLKKKKFAKPSTKKVEEKMPFANKKDLDAVVNYIKAARGRNMNDEQIKESLAKGGWKTEQIDYAFKSLTRPEEKVQEQTKVNETVKQETKPSEPTTEEKSPFINNQDEQAVINYVKDTLQKGYPPEKIKEALLKSGRTQEQVDYAFRKVKS